MALGLTQPLTEMSTRSYFLGEGECVGLTTLPPSCADFLKSGSLNLLAPSGPVQACNWIAAPFSLLPLPLFFSVNLHTPFCCVCVSQIEMGVMAK